MKDSTEANHTKRDFVNEEREQVDEAIKNKQMSQHAFAKLVPTGQVRSAFLFSTTVLDRRQDILLFSYARNIVRILQRACGNKWQKTFTCYTFTEEVIRELCSITIAKPTTATLLYYLCRSLSRVESGSSMSCSPITRMKRIHGWLLTSWSRSASTSYEFRHLISIN
jgi:hypothetical protein